MALILLHKQTLHHLIQLNLDKQTHHRLIQTQILLDKQIQHRQQIIQHLLHQHLFNLYYIFKAIFQKDLNVQAPVNAVQDHAVGWQLTGLLGFHIIIQYAGLMVDLISYKEIKQASTGQTLQYYIQRCTLVS